MTTALQVSRRKFLAGSAAAASGLSVGFHVPFAGEAAAQGAMAPEVNAWVVIEPDDAIVVRIARSEMGQGTLTGLAQLVVEELEGDWSKVTTEYPTPGQNLARNRVWQSYSTGAAESLGMVGAKPHGVLRSDAATIHAEAASKKLRNVSDH